MYMHTYIHTTESDFLIFLQRFSELIIISVMLYLLSYFIQLNTELCDTVHVYTNIIIITPS